MSKIILNELKKVKKTPHIDPSIWKQFMDRAHSSIPPTRDEHITDHFCSFYVPIDTQKKLIYLIIHKKSGLWMPPGGHIDAGESPVTAVYREYEEELNEPIGNGEVQLFNLSFDPIDNPIQPCKFHYSFWYIVRTHAHDFDYNTRESSDGKWFSLAEAQEKVTFHTFKEPLSSLSLYLEL